MKTLAEEWAAYAQACYGKQAISDIQLHETRQAFYSGAASMGLQLRSIIVELENGTITEDAATEELKARMSEATLFLNPHTT